MQDLVNAMETANTEHYLEYLWLGFKVRNRISGVL